MSAEECVESSLDFISNELYNEEDSHFELEESHIWQVMALLIEDNITFD